MISKCEDKGEILAGWLEIERLCNVLRRGPCIHLMEYMSKLHKCLFDNTLFFKFFVDLLHS